MKELKSKLKELSLRQPSPNYCERVLAQKPKASGMLTSWAVEPSPQQRPPNMWRIIMKSRITKLAAAAVIIIAALIGLTYWLPTGGPAPTDTVEIEIPPELAQMPVEKLLAIHFGKTETSFDRGEVAAAVERALGKLDGFEVLALSGKYRSGGGRLASRRAYHPKPLSEIVEASDLVVQARAGRVVPDVNDLKAAILKRELNQREDFCAWVKLTVGLEMVEAYPWLGFGEGERLQLRAVLSTERLNLLQEGRQYLIALRETDGRVWMLPYGEGVYPVEPNEAMVTGMRTGAMPVDEAWEFIMDSYDASHGGPSASEQVGDYWLGKLASENLTDCWTAVVYLDTLPEWPVGPGPVLDAIERQWRGLDSDCSYERVTFLKEAMEAVMDRVDASGAQRMLDLLENERTSSQPVLDKAISGATYARGLIVSLIRLIAQHPGPERRDRLERLFGIVGKLGFSERDKDRFGKLAADAIGGNEGEDIEQMLLDMNAEPGRYGIKRVLTLVRVWHALARRNNEQLKAYLEAFIADPENTDLKAEHCRGPSRTVEYAQEVLAGYRSAADKALSPKERIQSAIDKYSGGEGSLGSVISVMRRHLGPEDNEFVPFLCEVLGKNWEVPRLIAERVADPCFVPALRQALEKEVTGDLVGALYACGEKEEAIQIGAGYIEAFLNDPNRPKIDRAIERRLSGIIRFLGTTGDQAVVATVEYFADRGGTEGKRHLQGAAVMALARLGGEQGVSLLREIYKQERDIYVRIVTAVGLYYLGDDTGWDLLEHFVNNTERSVPEIEVRWHVDLAGGNAFQGPIVTYLRSPRTDALLLERLRHGISSGDTYTFSSSFVADYKTEILTILVEQLSNADRETRKYANEQLVKLTGQDFGFRPERFVGQQDEAIERWRAYIGQYLAER